MHRATYEGIVAVIAGAALAIIMATYWHVNELRKEVRACQPVKQATPTAIKKMT